MPFAWTAIAVSYFLVIEDEVVPASNISAIWHRSLTIWGSVVLIIASLYWARVVLIPIMLAVLLTFLLTPIVGTLERLRLGRVASVLLTVGLTAVVIGGLAWAFIHEIGQVAEELPSHRSTIV